MQRRIVRVFPLGEEDGVPYAIKKTRTLWFLHDFLEYIMQRRIVRVFPLGEEDGVPRLVGNAVCMLL